MNKIEALNHTKDLKYNHIDELPEHRLMPEDENLHAYKCRGNYIAGVRAHIGRLFSQNILNKTNTIEESKKFINYLDQRDRDKLTTKEEIRMINHILDILIEDLEGN